MVFEHLKVRPKQRATSGWANSVIDAIELAYNLGKRGDPDNPFKQFYGEYGYFEQDLFVQGKRVIKDQDPINIYDIFEPAQQKLKDIIKTGVESTSIKDYIQELRNKFIPIRIDEYGNIGVIISEPIDEYGNIRTRPYDPILRKVLYEEIIRALYDIGAINVDILATETSVADEILTDTTSSPVQVVTPTPGKRIDTRSCYLATNSQNGEVWAYFKDSGKLIGKIYADKFKAIALDSIRLTGDVDEPILIAWSGLDTGAKIFYVIRYKEI